MCAREQFDRIASIARYVFMHETARNDTAQYFLNTLLFTLLRCARMRKSNYLATSDLYFETKANKCIEGLSRIDRAVACVRVRMHENGVRSHCRT